MRPNKTSDENKMKMERDNHKLLINSIYKELHPFMQNPNVCGVMIDSRNIPFVIHISCHKKEEIPSEIEIKALGNQLLPVNVHIVGNIVPLMN